MIPALPTTKNDHRLQRAGRPAHRCAVAGIPRKHRRGRGFALVELLIAMGVGLIFMLALTTVLSNNSRTRHELELVSRQIENGRYALELLSDELNNAAFYGEAGFGQAPGVVAGTGTLPAIVCPTSSQIVTAPATYLGFPLFGFGEVRTDDPDAPQCANITPAALGFLFRDGANALPNDYIVIRRASTCAANRDAGCEPPVEGIPYLQLHACTAPAAVPAPPGAIDPAATPVTLQTGDWHITSHPSQLQGLTRACDPALPAPAYRLLNRLYFVAADNRPGDGIPTLKRAELAGGGYTIVPLVEGIEYLRFEYDTGAGFAGPEAVTEWSDVIAVRIHLIARDTRPTAGYRDEKTYRMGDKVLGGSGEGALFIDPAFRRQLYTATVRIPNLAANRE